MKKDVLIYLLFFVLTICFFFPFLTGNNIFGFRDLSLYFYPIRSLMVEMVKSGQLPLWNPYIFCGIPFFATLQAGFLYPLSLLFYILPFNLGFNYFIILHYFLAAVFTYILMRYYGAGRVGAAAAGVIFAFSGYLLSASNMNTTLTSAIWLPLVLLMWDLFLKDEGQLKGWLSIPFFSPGYFLGLVVLLSLMFLGGEPTILYSTVLLMMFYALFQKRVAKILYMVPLLMIVAALLMVQVLPFAEYVLNSVRMWRTELDFISHSSFPPWELVNLIFPNFWGNFLTGTLVKDILKENCQTWILSSYIGILPLFLAGLALKQRFKMKGFYLCAALFFLVLSLGSYTPIYKALFYMLPGLSAIRYPVKFLFFPVFAVAVMAGWGVERLEDGLRPAVIVFFSVLSALVLAGTSALYLFKREIHAHLAARLGLSEYNKFVLAKLLGENQQNLLFIFIILSVMFILVIAFNNKIIKKDQFKYSVVLVIAADLFIFNYALNPPISAELFLSQPANVASLKGDRSLFRYYVDPDVYEKSGSYFTNQNEILYSLKSKLSPNLIVPHRLYDFMGRESIEPLRNARIFWAFRDKFIGSRLPVLSRANVKYILSYEELESPDLRMVSAADFYLYQNMDYFPRAYIKEGYCQILRYTPDEVEIKAYADDLGKLVLADNYYPGWKAYLDGKPTQIEREQYLFRAVFVPPGWHQVVFRYEPDSVKIGAIISLFTLAGLFSFAGGALWWRKNR
jgi:hypothetical protein